MPDSDAAFDRWIAALDERHLADLTPAEVARALRALSSCYVERRDKLPAGGALESRGKRAAFALFYAPLHFLVVREIVRAVGDLAHDIAHILDVGCGTGAAGSAWALESRTRVTGIDRNLWATAEANWTYKTLRLRGRATRSDAGRIELPQRHGSAVLAAYTVNELPQPVREAFLSRILAAHASGSRIVIVEPIARRGTPWWTAWVNAFEEQGGRTDEWRFPARLPDRQRALAKAAGLDPRELTARSLIL